jgi:hypothetical protein
MIRPIEYKIVIEGEYYSRENLLLFIQNNEIVFDFLLQHNYLKSNSEKTNFLAFDFVGVITINDLLLCIFPKYYKGYSAPQNDLVSDFVIIIKALKKVGHSEIIPDSVNLSISDNGNFSEIVLADYFLKNYIECGIFRKNEESTLLNKEGEVNWGITVSELSPIFSRSYPIYHDVYVNTAITQEFNLITEVHKWVIKYCLNKYGRILDYDFHFTEDCVNDIFELGSVESMVNILRRELNILYTDRSILLINRLIYFLDKVISNYKRDFSVFGTGYFHVIWEKACSQIFLNKVDQFLEFIPSPKWNDLQGKFVHTDTLRPDIVSIEKEMFFLFDAKYYNISYKSNTNLSVSNNPGISDISKQFLYSLSFQRVPFSPKYNCFIFPKLMVKFFEIFGYVTISLFDTAIFNIYLSPQEVFKSFINNKATGQLALTRIADSIEKSKASERI